MRSLRNPWVRVALIAGVLGAATALSVYDLGWRGWRTLLPPFVIGAWLLVIVWWRRRSDRR